MALEAVSPASAALPELAHLHLLAHLAGVPTEASLSYKSLPGGGGEAVAAAVVCAWFTLTRRVFFSTKFEVRLRNKTAPTASLLFRAAFGGVVDWRE